MKNKISLFLSFLVLTGFCFNTFAQTKKIPPPDKEIAFDKGPVVIKQVPPVYPASMLEGGWEAMVYIKAFITTDGNVEDARTEKIQVKVIRTGESDTSKEEKQTDGKAFEESALASVYKWKFTPAQMQGKPVAVWVTIPFKFKLSGENKKTSVKDSDDVEMEKITETIKANIENILKGTDIEKAKQFVNKNALLIYNKETVNLFSVLNGEHKNIHLAEGKDSQRRNVNIKISDERSSILVIWKSGLSNGKNERIHSIVLTNTPSNEWKVLHWHVSF
jgi:TonB family protein